MNIDLVLKRLKLIKESKGINTISDTEASIILNELERLREENLLLKASEPMSKLQEDYGYKIEVDRLNNIINELEKYLIEYFKKEYPDRKLEDYNLENCTYDYALVILDKLQKLKGDGSNGN